MSHQTAPFVAQLTAAKQHAAKYGHADSFLAYTTLATTLAIHVATLALWPAALAGGWFAVLAWSIAHGLNLTRTFILAHDCAHDSTFASSAENAWFGSLLGSLVVMPFGAWRSRHLEHHAISGIEEEHGGDHGRTIFWSKQEWSQWPLWRKALLRIARDPFVFFTAGAVVVFFLLGGGAPGLVVPEGSQQSKSKSKEQQPGGMVTSVCMFAMQLIILACVMPDQQTFIKLLATMLGLCFPIAASVGLCLYHLQHYVNKPYRVPRTKYSRDLAAFMGSTCLEVPWIFKWATLGIEYHHIHHLCTRVPCYKLQACHEEAPAGTWEGITVVTPSLALRSLFNVMWDEDAGMYVSFAEYEAAGSKVSQVLAAAQGKL